MNQHSDHAVVIERKFDAPVELVWKMWTEPEHFKSWYGPQGAGVPVADLDVRVGGARRVCMEVKTPNGEMRMWFAGEYLEVVPNERLVFTDFMADEDGNAQPAPEGHPASTEVRVEPARDGQGTRMVMTHVGLPTGSPGAAGWSAAFDKLEYALGQGSG